VVVVSLVPDVIVGAKHDLAGGTWGGVTALMVMYLIVAVCGVVALRSFLPLTTRPASAAKG
jgi:hypothetical protein